MYMCVLDVRMATCIDNTELFIFEMVCKFLTNFNKLLSIIIMYDIMPFLYKLIMTLC